jgi:hypothetical protein
VSSFSWVHYSSLLSINNFTKYSFVLAMLFSLLEVSKIMKRTRKRGKHHAIKYLSNDLLMEVFIKVVSTFLPNLLNLKSSLILPYNFALFTYTYFLIVCYCLIYIYIYSDFVGRIVKLRPVIMDRLVPLNLV